MSGKFDKDGDVALSQLEAKFERYFLAEGSTIVRVPAEVGSHWTIQATHKDWAVTFDFSMAGDLFVSVVCPRKPPSGRGTSIEMVMHDLDISDVMQFVRLATCVVAETPG